jgi:ABC-type branched-subunit amino acid transport system ATPase component
MKTFFNYSLFDINTILMIEHDPTILRFADHVIHLENGELISEK